MIHQNAKVLALLFVCSPVFLVASQCMTGASTNSSTNPIILSPGKTYGLIYYSKRGSANKFENRGSGGLYLTNLTTWQEQSLTDINNWLGPSKSAIWLQQWPGFPRASHHLIMTRWSRTCYVKQPCLSSGVRLRCRSLCC